MNQTNISSIVELVSAFQAHFQITWIVILQDEEGYAKNLISGLRKNSNFTYLSVNDLRTFAEVTQSLLFYQSVLVLSLFPNWIRNNTLKIWFWNEIKFKMSEFVWLTITKDVNYFSNIYIPFDCEFLISETIDQNHYKNFEIYHTGYNSNLYYSDFGLWDSVNGLLAKEKNFDLRRINLHKQELLVYNEKSQELPDDWFSVTAAAIYADACEDISKRLNAKVIFTTDKNDSYDLNVVPNRIIPGENIGPIFIFRYDIFLKAPSRSFSWDNYIKPYSPPFRIVMFLTATKWLITLIIIYKSLSYVYPLPLEKTKKGDSIFKVILADNTNKPPTYISATIMFIFKIMARIILQSAYSAIFMSFVTFVISKPPFTTLEGLAENGNYKILALPSRSYVYYELAAEDKAIRDLKEQFLVPKEQQPHTYEEAFDLVCYSEKNYVTDFPAKLANELRLRMKECIISDVTIKLIYGAGSWVTKKNSSFRRALNFWSLRLIEAGIFDPMIWSRSSSLRQFNPKNVTRPIDIIDCGILLIVLAFGLCFSIVIFSLETFYHKLMKPKYKRLKMQYAIKKWKGQPFLK